jgi:hypothetical protein
VYASRGVGRGSVTRHMARGAKRQYRRLDRAAQRRPRVTPKVRAYSQVTPIGYVLWIAGAIAFAFIIASLGSFTMV